MKWLFAALPFFIAPPLLIFSAIWQGKETERWGEIPEMKEFAARLDKLPLEIGPWKGKRAAGLPESMRKAAGASGDVEIVYTNEETNEQADMFIVVGRLLDMSKHRPDRCYPAQGYKAVGDEAVLQKVKTATNSQAEFRTAVYSKEETGMVRIYWSWSSDRVWKGPDGEDGLRKVFRRTQPIYKLYVSNQVRSPNEHAGEGPSIDLIKLLVPAYDKVLFPTGEKAAIETAASGKAALAAAATNSKSATN